LANARFPTHIPAHVEIRCHLSQCSAGYRRIALASRKGTQGEYRCLLCDHVIEVFDGSFEIALRLTIQPEKTFK
jgi:hypothetical protein